MATDPADALRQALTAYLPDGFRDEDGVWHDGPVLQDALAALAALLAVGERDRRERDLYKRQLDVVDAMLGPWEPAPSAPNSAVGRVQTIKNLLVDRARGERDRQHIAQLTAAVEGLLTRRTRAMASRRPMVSLCCGARVVVPVDVTVHIIVMSDGSMSDRITDRMPAIRYDATRCGAEINEAYCNECGESVAVRAAGEGDT